MPSKLTQAEFIAKSQAVHGAAIYDYSRTAYTSSKSPVNIICLIHGAFEQTPDKHMQGKGCMKCAIDGRGQSKRQRAANLFLSRAKAIHGNKYDYSAAIYTGNKKTITVICRQHGPFNQRAGNHIQKGYGCPICSNRAPITLSDFINRAQVIHGYKYDYSPTDIINTQLKVAILCPIHGLFNQAPNKHLAGQGCPGCKLVTLSSLFSQTLAGFIEKAKGIHGDKYDYSLSTYTKKDNKLTIICPDHGSFEQVANVHVQGGGCPKCAQRERGRLSWLELAKGRKAILYFVRLYSPHEEFYKVGVTYLSVAERYKHHPHLPAGYQYEILAQHVSENAAAVYDWEQSIIESFRRLSYRPKAAFGGETECFSSCDEILAIFPL